MHKFRLTAVDGPNEWDVDCDSFRVYNEDGSWIELHPRRSDGDITLSARDRLVVRPVASNCATVETEGS